MTRKKSEGEEFEGAQTGEFVPGVEEVQEVPFEDAEPSFTLVASDRWSIHCLNLWLDKAMEAGFDQSKVSEVTQIRNNMADWQRNNSDKIQKLR